MSAVYQANERIKTITTENRKLIDRLMVTKAAVDNRAPRKPTGYHVEISPTNKKGQRVESLNLMIRIRESERIML